MFRGGRPECISGEFGSSIHFTQKIGADLADLVEAPAPAWAQVALQGNGPLDTQLAADDVEGIEALIASRRAKGNVKLMGEADKMRG